MALAGGVGVAALAACGEGEVEIREVEVEKIVTVTEIQQVEVEKVVTQEVIKEVEKEVVVTQEVVVEKEVIVEKEVVVEIEAETAARGALKGINLFRSDEAVPLGEWNPTRGGRITWGTPGPITSFNPVRMDQWSYRSGFPMYETLYTWAPNNRIIPRLAADMPELSDDRLTRRIPLRQDVVFHDGTPFNADAVTFNFMLFLDESLERGEIAGQVGDIESVTKVDDYTIDLKTKTPQALFMQVLADRQITFASPQAYITYREDIARNPVGTGPYKFKEWQEQVSVTYERNEDYAWAPEWATNQGAPYPDEFVIQILAQDAVARAAAFEAGEVDWIQHFQFIDMERFAKQDNRAILGRMSSGMPWFLHINSTRWPTDDIVVRKALNHAVNKKLVVQRGNGGIPRIAGNILTPGTIGYNADMEDLYPWDVGKANQLLDDAGYTRGEDGFRYRDGQRMQVEFPNTPNPLSELYKLDIESGIGIFVDIPNVEFATYINDMAQGKYTHQWTGGRGPDADVLYAKYHTSNYGLPGRAFAFLNYNGEPGVATEGDPIDALLDGARAEFDESKRAEMWMEANRLIQEAAVNIPLADAMAQWFYNSDQIGGVAHSTLLDQAFAMDFYDKKGG
ncbi:MAG: ABC transporter substrate-binding protein [Chloroflexota bacterium]|nr:ABC transporter substrate-binding protein [Chloroflexota bacterium]